LAAVVPPGQPNPAYPTGPHCAPAGQIATLTVEAADVIDLYLTESVVWKRPGAPDKWGTPAAGTEQTIPARIERTTRLVRDFSGREVTSDAAVLMREQPAHDDTLHFDGRDHPILRIAEKKSFSVSHYQVYVA
jgi:ketosteroid isomerase-like protein